jgi:glycosyltransferase involved in cell wall biosynthesis
MINIWMPVFNEALFIEKTLISILNQSYREFKLLISDNHSTDGSRQIIENYEKNDSRIIIVSPPNHLKSIDHTNFIMSDALNKISPAKYTLFSGGHDIYSPNLLQILLDRSEKENNSSIVYTDTYDIDENDKINFKWDNLLQVRGLMKSLVPHHVILGLTYNVTFHGLWREECRRKLKIRHSCSAADHFLIAEMALMGDVLYQPGSAVHLRRTAAHRNKGIQGYAQRHISDEIVAGKDLDFANQLEWVKSIAERAAAMDPFTNQEPIKKILINSLLSAYICRYRDLLSISNDGAQSFFGNENIKAALSLSSMSADRIFQFIQEKSIPHNA